LGIKNFYLKISMDIPTHISGNEATLCVEEKELLDQNGYLKTRQGTVGWRAGASIIEEGLEMEGENALIKLMNSHQTAP
jgi:hypothetical protein